MRYPDLNVESMTPHQREVAAAIERRHPGGLVGLYRAMLYSPEMADRVHALGEQLRCGLRIAERLRILAVLVTVGRHDSRNIETFATLKSVVESGLDPRKVEALVRGERPADFKEDEAAVYQFSLEVSQSGRTRAKTYDRLVALLGCEAALELVAVCGFTAMMTNLLTVTQTSVLQEGADVV
ncbi:hypothetical protein [uncultured Pigmentiphaga sp.]|jgi:hypothetical protein|uniref:hypothetical protein n=1 Tax=uncultured Pigmentiphaga sp. TaxID=340361 RepID=UPI002601B94B|nr:hypothetical protein [uncultured Pigmentiphaga sp.]